MNIPKNEFSFIWTIQNYSYFPQLYGKCESPEFTPEGFEGTSWILRLLPDALQQHVGTLYLVRGEDAGPEEFSVKLEMSVTTFDGSILYLDECEHTFGNLSLRSFKVYVNMDQLQSRTVGYLPVDTLVVCCKMWKGEGSFQNKWRCEARTRIGIEKITFIHEVDNFSTFDEKDKKVLQIPSKSKAEVSFSSSLYLDTQDLFGCIRIPDAVIVETRCSDRNYILARKKISLIGSSENPIECAKVDYRHSHHRAVELQMLKTFTKTAILENKAEYLSNDQLRLLCEFTFCSDEQSEIEEVENVTPIQARNTIGKRENETAVKSAHPLASEDTKRNDNQCLSTDVTSPTKPLESLNQMATDDSSNGKLNVVEKLQPTSACNTIDKNNARAAENSLPAASEDTKNIGNDECPTDKTEASRKIVPLNELAGHNQNEGSHSDVGKPPAFPNVTSDLKALYSVQLLTDIELKTATKSFAAHKLVLCIRSSVFRALLTDNMTVKNTSFLQVDDMDDEIVDQFLLFLYANEVGNLQWESAIQLYRAGDKYNIETLKELCSTFLVNNFSTSTASEVLVLADEHNDAELKQLIENFILAHDKEVFSSEEWIKLSQTNLQLVNKTMLLKYCGGQRGK